MLNEPTRHDEVAGGRGGRYGALSARAAAQLVAALARGDLADVSGAPFRSVHPDSGRNTD